MENEACTIQESPHQVYTDYDRFAWFYNRYWGNEFSRPALALYNSLLYPHLPDRCSILDLCCGTGQIARGLAASGYQSWWIVCSRDLIKFRRDNCPCCRFY